jgi:hypothetical protein
MQGYFNSFCAFRKQHHMPVKLFTIVILYAAALLLGCRKDKYDTTDCNKLKQEMKAGNVTVAGRSLQLL